MENKSLESNELIEREFYIKRFKKLPVSELKQIWDERFNNPTAEQLIEEII